MILPSVGAQSGGRLAQMIAAKGQQELAAALSTRQQAFQQQQATAGAKAQKQALMISLLQQRAERRRVDRAAREPSYFSRLAESWLTDQPIGALFETNKWGKKAIPESRTFLGYEERRAQIAATNRSNRPSIPQPRPISAQDVPSIPNSFYDGGGDAGGDSSGAGGFSSGVGP